MLEQAHQQVQQLSQTVEERLDAASQNNEYAIAAVEVFVAAIAYSW